MLIFHLYPGFGILRTLNANQAIFPAPSVYLSFQALNSKQVESAVLTIHLKIGAINVPPVDCCSWILFDSALRVTTTHISPRVQPWGTKMFLKYLVKTGENMDYRYHMEFFYNIMSSAWSESRNVNTKRCSENMGYRR